LVAFVPFGWALSPYRDKKVVGVFVCVFVRRFIRLVNKSILHLGTTLSRRTAHHLYTTSGVVGVHEGPPLLDPLSQFRLVEHRASHNCQCT
jgi:hypothetical protein